MVWGAVGVELHGDGSPRPVPGGLPLCLRPAEVWPEDGALRESIHSDFADLQRNRVQVVAGGILEEVTFRVRSLFIQGVPSWTLRPPLPPLA